MAFTFVDSSNTTVGFTGTSTNITIPVSAEEDDLLVLHIMHRDTLGVLSGWTLGTTRAVDTGSILQYFSVFYKLASSGDPGDTLTIAQGSSARLEAHIQVFSYDADPTDIVLLTETTGAELDVSIRIVHPVTSASLMILGGAFTNAGAGNAVTFTSPWIRTVGASHASTRRLGAAYRMVSEGSFVREGTISGSQATGGGISAGLLAFIESAPSDVLLNQQATLVLWGTGSLVQVQQAGLLALSTFPRRRLITITD